MGKSPGKWIKGIFFGKKSSRSSLSKGRELSKSASAKASLVSSKEKESALTVETLSISEPVRSTFCEIKENSNFEEGDSAKFPSDGLISSSGIQDEGRTAVTDLSLQNDSEKTRLEKAAVVIQATSRGYLARRTFKALKGIIRLQAVIRGHLVRRQAVATLYCVHGIVKFQALVRGCSVRRSCIHNEAIRRDNLEAKDGRHSESCKVNRCNQRLKSLKNAFICKLLASSPTAMPLHLQYGIGETNSSWDWLLRWSVRQVWASNSKLMETSDCKCQTTESEKSRPKGNGRREASSNSETEKATRNPRKMSSLFVKSAEDHPQTEKYRVKHAQKKIQKTPPDISVRTKVDAEKTKSSGRKPSNPPAPECSKHVIDAPSDKQMEDLEQAVSKINDTETSCNLLGANASVKMISHQSHQSEDDKAMVQVSKDDEGSNDDQKASKRRASLPAEHNIQEISPRTAARVPSYMATTQSSKAKVRTQSSPRFGQDTTDRDGFSRRHSLPTLTNGKHSSSPRVQNLVQASGRGANKIDRSLSSSRDDKVLQAEWRR